MRIGGGKVLGTWFGLGGGLWGSWGPTLHAVVTVVLLRGSPKGPSQLRQDAFGGCVRQFPWKIHMDNILETSDDSDGFRNGI